MSAPVKPAKRTYDSSRRRDQARRTRLRVIEAATELFVEHGYGATSIAAIARAAGVSPQTIYAAFGTKAALLGEAVGVAMAGDDEPVPIFDRPASQAVLDAPGPEEAAQSFAEVATRLLERAGRVLHAAEGAAQQDPELRELWIDGHRRRLADMQRVARAFDAAGFLRDGLSAGDAADLLWTLASPDAFRAHTVIRGWSARRFERWLAASVRRAVMAP
jgi:AcrR family transcriptional regulator